MKIETYKEPFSKNTVYRFCNDTGINWHKFLRFLSERVIRQFIRPATSDKRIEYFVLDDTPFTKTGRKSELVAKYFFHVSMTYQYGFRILTLIWTDEYSSIPIDFCPLSSGKSSLLMCGPKKHDGRSIAGQIRKQSQQKAPDIILDMPKKAIRAGHSAKYWLMQIRETVSTERRFKTSCSVICRRFFNLCGNGYKSGLCYNNLMACTAFSTFSSKVMIACLLISF